MSIPSHEQLEFQLFESEQVDEIKKDHPEYNQKEVASEVKIRWKALEDNEKKIYQEMLDKPSQSDTQYDEEPLFLTNGDKRMKLTIDEEKG
ncbi:MAG: hypothetical protein EZS28_019467 [Streblomastix strix]|uniref:HMG box domain-containing protein n=1 Tax=Streblomastix strix TaxID=222440 RepID=A0A5J4VQQ8_9EUKA|nr:MAG: hypothetical protein EZS28_019467 [Streblomastix strix]